MKCRLCQAEIEEGALSCPVCGELQLEHSQTEQPAQNDYEKEKKPSGISVLLVAVAALLLAALVMVIVLKVNMHTESPNVTNPSSQATTQTTAATTPETQPQMTASDFLMYADVALRDSYSVDADALAAAKDQIVATAGDFSLNGEMLQVFYWTQVNDFLNQYGAYAYYLYGLDSSAPLDTQYVNGVDVTWEQYFLDSGLSMWYQCAQLNTLAKEQGFTLDADLVAVLDDMLVDLEADALENGYADADALVADAIGPGCTAQGYYDYMMFYWTAMYYNVELVESFQPTQEEIRAYYDAHTAEFEESGITEDSAPYVDVRHILIMPKGGTTDVSGKTTYSEAEWDACYKEAQAILDAWAAGEATEESFAALANEHSEDGGSNTTGGLYQDVTDDGKYVPEFTQWCIAEGRVVGDTGIVKTTYGYHIMYCSSVNEAWYRYALDSVVYELFNEKLDEVAERCVMDYDLNAMCLGAMPAPETAAPEQ